MIVGTAGHISTLFPYTTLFRSGHSVENKTALLEALTGQVGDRRQEERARGMTIDLGYRYAALADGEPLTGFIDVPGHERFIHNMLAGAQGIDLVLLVIAADDGVMPQTREHLAIIELLGIPQALIGRASASATGWNRRAWPRCSSRSRRCWRQAPMPGRCSFRCRA